MEKRLVWDKLVGQERVKETLTAAFESSSMAHAYLFSGPAGCGKFQAALELALALLCESDRDVPCYKCKSCRLVLSYSHPDFYSIFPVEFTSKHKKTSSELSDAGWEFIAEETKKRLEMPYLFQEATHIMNIPVEVIRELNHSILRGPTKGNIYVSIICDVDVMNLHSANAMLKTLEEPPDGTVMLLLTQRPAAVLPTVRSRCQIVRFGYISPEKIAQSLAKENSMQADDPKIIHAVECADGSLGRARSLMGESLDVFVDCAENVWKLCLENASKDVLASYLEKIMKKPLQNGRDYIAAEKILTSFLRLVRQTYFYSIKGTEKYFNNKLLGSELSSLPEINVETAEKLYNQCEKAISGVRARGNMLLVFITFILSVQELVHGKE